MYGYFRTQEYIMSNAYIIRIFSRDFSDTWIKLKTKFGIPDPTWSMAVYKNEMGLNHETANLECGERILTIQSLKKRKIRAFGSCTYALLQLNLVKVYKNQQKVRSQHIIYVVLVLYIQACVPRYLSCNSSKQKTNNIHKKEKKNEKESRFS